MSKTAQKTLLALCALSILASCGGGGGGGGTTSNAPVTPVNQAPTISAFTYSPNRAMPYIAMGISTAVVSGSLTYTDSDGIADLASVSIGGTTFPASALSISGNVVSLSVVISLASSGTQNFTVTARDKAGNVSNGIPGTFEVGYRTNWSAGWSQANGQSLTIAANPSSSAYPTCAKIPAAGTFSLSAFTGNNCHTSGFTATAPDNTTSQWQSMLAFASLCSTNPATGVNFTTDPMFRSVDAATGSENDYTFSTSTVLIETTVYCH
mgnify:CR=1 FL=1